MAAANPPGDPAAEALARTALPHPDLAAVLLRAPDPDAPPPSHLAASKGAVGGAAAADARRGGVCSPPVADPAAPSTAPARPAAPATA